MLKKFLALSLFSLLGFNSLWAQEDVQAVAAEAYTQALAPEDTTIKDGLTPSLTAKVNFSRSSHKNWQVEGKNALTWEAHLDGSLKWKAGRSLWSNAVNLGYGQSQFEDEEARKSLDLLKVESRYSFTIAKFLDDGDVNSYFGALLESQFADTKEYGETDTTVISSFWDPGYLIWSLGMGFKPMNNVETRLGGAVKQTFIDKYPPANDEYFSDNPNEDLKTELGLEWILEGKYTFSKIMELSAKFSLFANFDGGKEKTDLKLETALKASPVSYLSFSLNVDWLYDHDQSKNTQQRDLIAVGLQYSFF